MKVTLEKVFTKVKETKRGEALNVGLKIKESTIEDINGETVAVNDRWLNAFFDKDFEFPYNDGDEAEVLIVQNGEYLNFKLPGVGKAPAPDASAFVAQIKEIKERLEVLEEKAGIERTETVPEPEEVEDPDDF